MKLVCVSMQIVCVCVHVYLRRTSFHIKLSGDDALLAENSSHLVHLTTFHSFHQPIIILVPICVLTMTWTISDAAFFKQLFHRMCTKEERDNHYNLASILFNFLVNCDICIWTCKVQFWHNNRHVKMIFLLGAQCQTSAIAECARNVLYCCFKNPPMGDGFKAWEHRTPMVPGKLI